MYKLKKQTWNQMAKKKYCSRNYIQHSQNKGWLLQNLNRTNEDFLPFLDLPTVWTWCCGSGSRFVQREFGIFPSQVGGGQGSHQHLWKEIFVLYFSSKIFLDHSYLLQRQNCLFLDGWLDFVKPENKKKIETWNLDKRN